MNTAAQGFDTDRESFVGLYNGFDAPECVVAGRPKNSIAHGWSPIASHYIEVELQPGESKDYIFVLGYVENEQEEKYESNGELKIENGELLKPRWVLSTIPSSISGRHTRPLHASTRRRRWTRRLPSSIVIGTTS